MARRRRDMDVRPTDPREAEEWDRAKAAHDKTKADQRSAGEQYDKDAERRGKAFKEGDKSVKARLKGEAAARDKVAADRAKQREKMLQTPLSVEEVVGLEDLERAAMSGQSIPPDEMRRLRDLRIRSQVDTKKMEAKKDAADKLVEEKAAEEKAAHDEQNSLTKGQQKTKRENDARKAEAEAIAAENKK